MACLLASVFLASAAGAVPVPFRNPADGRAWQVAIDGSAPIVWSWSEGAVSATVTVSNLLSAATSSSSVLRGESPDGAFTLPSGGGLQDVRIDEIDSSSAVVNTLTARVRTGSDRTIYAGKSDRGFAKLTEPRIYCWSSLWTNETENASSASVSASVKNGAAIGSWALPSTGGYDAFGPRRSFGRSSGDVSVALAFDGTDWWTADLHLVKIAFGIYLR